MLFKHEITSSQTRLTFDGKPSDEIRAVLKGAGFRWSPQTGCWWRRGCKGAADFILALDRRLNPGRPDGACWMCGDARGFFRPEGAATPVRCDECQEAVRAQRINAPKDEYEARERTYRPSGYASMERDGII